ncbi:MAG: DMT family transporter [Caulobacterales bacterium]
MTRWQADALILFAAMVWGLAFIGQATAMEHVGAMTFTGWRFAISAVVVAPFAFLEARKAAPMPKGGLNGVLLLGVVFFLASALQQLGLKATSVTNAGFLTALYVVMVPVIGVLFLKHKQHPAIWIGIALSLAGTALLSGGGKLGALGQGDGLVIASALFWALQILMISALSQRMNRPFALAFAQYAIVAALGIVCGFVFEAATLPPFKEIAVELLFTGVLSGGVCFTLQAIAQRYTPASDAAILMSAEALFAALGGAILLGDRLTPPGWTGCALILFAVLLVQLAPLWKLRRAA